MLSALLIEEEENKKEKDKHRDESNLLILKEKVMVKPIGEIC